MVARAAPTRLETGAVAAWSLAVAVGAISVQDATEEGLEVGPVQVHSAAETFNTQAEDPMSSSYASIVIVVLGFNVIALALVFLIKMFKKKPRSFPGDDGTNSPSDLPYSPLQNESGPEPEENA